MTVKELRVSNKQEILDSEVGSREHQHLLKVTMLPNEHMPQVIRVQESSHLRNESLTVSDQSITIRNHTQEYTNFNRDVVILNLSELTETDGAVNHFSNELWISKDLKQVVVMVPNTGEYMDWEQREVLDSFTPESEDHLRLKTMFMSPSQEKKKEVTCLRWDGNVERLESVMDVMTDKAYSLFKEGRDLSYGELVKGGSRLAQGLSPSTKLNGYNLKSTAILLSKDIREFADGGGFFRSKPGYPVGLGAQLRNHATDKWFGIAVDDDTMNGIVKNHSKEGIVYVEQELEKGNVTPEEVQKYMDMAFEREDRGPWAEKVVVFGDASEAPDTFMDLNIVKASMDFLSLLPTSLDILDLAGPTQANKVVFGSQMMFSLLLTEEGKDLMEELLAETIASSVVPGSDEAKDNVKELCNVLATKPIDRDKERELVKDIITDYYNKTPIVPTFEDFEDSIDYSSGLIDMINPRWARTMDQSTKESIEGALANKMSDVLSEFKPEVDGKFCRVMADFAGEFGIVLLEDNEMCAPDLQTGEVLAIRSPKGGIKEQAIYNNIPVSEMVRRVNKSDLSYRDKETLKGMFKSLRRRAMVAIVPSSDEVKLLHSGMDFDFDGVTFIEDERIIDILKQHSPIIVHVTDEGGAPSKERYPFDLTHIQTLIEDQFNNGNLPVGVVCNHNHSWVMLNSDLDFARTVLKDLNGDGGSRLEYEGLEYTEASYGRVSVEINQEKTNEILAEFKKLDFDSLEDEAITRIINDINVMMNRYIQVTIDASKSGEVVDIPEALLINDEVAASSLSDVTFKLYGEYTTSEGYKKVIEDRLSARIQSGETTHHKVEIGSTSKFYFNDGYHMIRRRVARAALRILIELAVRDAKLDDEMVRKRDRTKYNKNLFLHFSHIFYDVSAARRKLLSEAMEEERPSVNRDFRDTLTYLANSIRVATIDMTPEERVLAAIDIATNKVGDVNTTANTFPSSTLTWEYINLCSNHKDGINFIGERINNVKGLVDGERVRVIKNAIAGEGFVPVEDGLYTIREYEDTFYATRSLAELTKPMTDANDKVIIRLSYNQDFEKISKDLKDKEIVVENYTTSSIGDNVNGHKIDLPNGFTDYTKAISGVPMNNKKQVVSVSQRRNGAISRQMFLCLEAQSSFKDVSKTKSGVIKKKSTREKLAPKSSPVKKKLTVSGKTDRKKVINNRLTLTKESNMGNLQEAPVNNDDSKLVLKKETKLGNKVTSDSNTPEDNKVMLEKAKRARAVYEDLSKNEKEMFPKSKLRALEELEAKLGIDNSRVEEAVDAFDFL